MAEFVLSGDRFLWHVTRGLDDGHRCTLAFIADRAGELNAARVADRVAEGEHWVHTDRVLARVRVGGSVSPVRRGRALRAVARECRRHASSHEPILVAESWDDQWRRHLGQPERHRD